MNEEKFEINDNARELNDEEIEQVSGGINGASKHCASCGAKYDYDDTKCPVCGRSEYNMKKCAKCNMYFDFYSPDCPKCHVPNYYWIITCYPNASHHQGPR